MQAERRRDTQQLKEVIKTGQGKKDKKEKTLWCRDALEWKKLVR